MIDFNINDNAGYEPPAIVRVAAIVDLAAELEKHGISLRPNSYEPGDPVDWSSGRVS
jgi:hypothetical protein